MDLYNLRDNLEDKENPATLQACIELLIGRPLLDPASGVRRNQTLRSVRD